MGYTVIPNKMPAYNTTANREFVYKAVLNQGFVYNFFCAKKKQTYNGLLSIMIFAALPITI